MSLNRERPHEATFDLTPMIDVVLLLIIFFMLSSQFAHIDLKPLNLPKEHGRTAAANSTSTVIIDLDDQGRISVFGKVVDAANLKSALVGSEAKAQTVPECIVRADRNCTAGHLNKVAEALAAAGVKYWKLATAGGARTS